MRRSDTTTITPSGETGERVSIRFAVAADEEQIRSVAGRDTRRVPPDRLIVAEVDGCILAARSLATGGVVADPFTWTADLVEMLELHAAHLHPTPHWLRPPPALRQGRYAHA